MPIIGSDKHGKNKLMEFSFPVKCRGCGEEIKTTPFFYCPDQEHYWHEGCQLENWYPFCNNDEHIHYLISIVENS